MWWLRRLVWPYEDRIQTGENSQLNLTEPIGGVTDAETDSVRKSPVKQHRGVSQNPLVDWLVFQLWNKRLRTHLKVQKTRVKYPIHREVKGLPPALRHGQERVVKQRKSVARAKSLINKLSFLSDGSGESGLPRGQ